MLYFKRRARVVVQYMPQESWLSLSFLLVRQWCLSSLFFPTSHEPIIFWCSIAHPYLLADNRHYTFYIWRKVIQVNWMMKYMLIPLYVYSWLSIINILSKSLLLEHRKANYLYKINELYLLIFSSCREITDKDLGVIICAVSCTGPCTCPAGWIQILHNSICDTVSSLSSNWQWQIACYRVTLCSRWLVYSGDVSVPTIPLGTRAWNTKVYVVV